MMNIIASLALKWIFIIFDDEAETILLEGLVIFFII